MQPTVLQWFMSQIETFAPAAQREERQQLYADIGALPSSPSITLYDDVVSLCSRKSWRHTSLLPRGSLDSAQSVRAPMPRGMRKSVSAWQSYCMQIAESPVVASFQSAVTYYEAADVTCQHGRNQKTCEALYALRFTLHLLERHQASRWARKQVERLRQREPHLPQLNDLCAPLEPVPDEAPGACARHPWHSHCRRNACAR